MSLFAMLRSLAMRDLDDSGRFWVCGGFAPKRRSTPRRSAFSAVMRGGAVVFAASLFFCGCAGADGASGFFDDDEEEPTTGNQPPKEPVEPGGAGGARDPGPPGQVARCEGLGDWSADWTAFEGEVLELVNARRREGANCGGEEFPPTHALSLSGVLSCTSRAHSQDMALRDFFEHDNPDGDSPFDRMAAAGYQFRAAGENIAAGQRGPEEVMESWMNSPGHCKNIMSGDFTELGVGYFTKGGPEQPGGRGYWTQNFGRPL